MTPLTLLNWPVRATGPSAESGRVAPEQPGSKLQTTSAPQQANNKRFFLFLFCLYNAQFVHSALISCKFFAHRPPSSKGKPRKAARKGRQNNAWQPPGRSQPCSPAGPISPRWRCPPVVLKVLQWSADPKRGSGKRPGYFRLPEQQQ